MLWFDIFLGVRYGLDNGYGYGLLMAMILFIYRLNIIIMCRGIISVFKVRL